MIKNKVDISDQEDPDMEVMPSLQRPRASSQSNSKAFFDVKLKVFDSKLNSSKTKQITKIYPDSPDSNQLETTDTGNSFKESSIEELTSPRNQIIRKKPSLPIEIKRGCKKSQGETEDLGSFSI